MAYLPDGTCGLAPINNVGFHKVETTCACRFEIGNDYSDAIVIKAELLRGQSEGFLHPLIHLATATEKPTNVLFVELV